MLYKILQTLRFARFVSVKYDYFLLTADENVPFKSKVFLHRNIGLMKSRFNTGLKAIFKIYFESGKDTFFNHCDSIETGLLFVTNVCYILVFMIQSQSVV